MLGGSVFFIGIPVLKFIKALLPTKKRNSLVEAREHLEQARLEAEAARLNREAEEVYQHLYEETLAEEETVEANKQEKR